MFIYTVMANDGEMTWLIAAYRKESDAEQRAEDELEFEQGPEGSGMHDFRIEKVELL